MIIVVSSIVELSVNKILLRIRVREDDWAANRAIIVNVMELKCQLREIIFHKHYVTVTD